MKKICKTFALFFILSFSPNLFAQNVQVTWGPELKIDSRMTLDGIIGDNANSFYTLNSSLATLFSSSHTSINQYSKTDMNLMQTKELVIPNKDGKKVNFERLFYLKGKMILFTSFYNSSEDKNYAFVQYVKDDGTLNPNYKEVDEITATKKSNDGGFDFVRSTDSSKILVYHSEAYDKNTNQKIHYKVLDTNLNEIWSKELELPYKDKNCTVFDYTVDNNGDVYMLAQIELEKDQQQKGNPKNYRYEIVYYNHTTDALKEYNVNIGQKFISSIRFELNSTGDLVCAGYYSNKDNYGEIGAFYLKINGQTKNVIATGFQEFDKDLLAKFIGVKEVNKGEEEYNLGADAILFHNDGTAYLIGEEYWMQVISNFNPRNNLEYDTYVNHANNILIVNFAANASVVWTKCIVKNQELANSGKFYSSYSVQEVGKKLFFMYNDNSKNLKIQDPNKYKTMSNPYKSVAMLITIDEKGNEQRNPLFSAKDLDVTLRPMLSFQVNPTTMIIYGEKLKKYKFGRVTFN